jgi:hypothetical protein
MLGGRNGVFDRYLHAAHRIGFHGSPPLNLALLAGSIEHH